MRAEEMIGAIKDCSKVTVNRLSSYTYSDDGKLQTILEDVKLPRVEGTECTDVEYDENGRVKRTNKTIYEGRGLRKSIIGTEVKEYEYGAEIDGFTSCIARTYLTLKDDINSAQMRIEVSAIDGKYIVITDTEYNKDGTLKSQRIKRLLRKDESPVEEVYEVYAAGGIVSKTETKYDKGREVYRRDSNENYSSEIKYEDSGIDNLLNSTHTFLSNGVVTGKYSNEYSRAPFNTIESRAVSSEYRDNKWENNTTVSVYKCKDGKLSLISKEYKGPNKETYSSQCKCVNGCNVLYYNGDIYINREDSEDTENLMHENGLRRYNALSGDLEYWIFGNNLEGHIVYEDKKIKSIDFVLTENNKSYYVDIRSHMMLGCYGYSFEVEEKDLDGNILRSINASARSVQRDEELQALTNVISTVFLEHLRMYKGYNAMVDYTDTGYQSIMTGCPYEYLLDQFEKG